MKRAILLLILATTCFFVNAQKQVLYLPTQNGVEVTNVEDYRWVYATSAGCNVQIGPQTRVITATIPFSQIRDSLGRNFAQVTQRYFVGGTPSTRSALVQLKSIRNVITKGGYTTIQIRNPDQEYQVTESLQDVIDLVSFPVGDGSGVTGGGVTGDTIYIINDGGVSPPDTFFIAIPGGSGGNGIFGVPDTVPSGMVATIDSGIVFNGPESTSFFHILLDNGLGGTRYEQDQGAFFLRYFDIGGDNSITIDPSGVEIRADGPDRITLDGATRITDLVTDPATKLVGTDADGDLSSLVLGPNLSISGDTLNATGVLLGLPYYTGDAAALAGGLSMGDPYLLECDNDYSLPGGIFKVVKICGFDCSYTIKFFSSDAVALANGTPLGREYAVNVSNVYGILHGFVKAVATNTLTNDSLVCSTVLPDYDNDAGAITGGLTIGDLYDMTASNTYGAPDGTNRVVSTTSTSIGDVPVCCSADATLKYFDNDTSATGGGLSAGNYYYLSASNTYGFPYGTKKRIQ